jgi:hypothetical protein
MMLTPKRVRGGEGQASHEHISGQGVRVRLSRRARYPNRTSTLSPCCFEVRCGKQGDVIDLWAALWQMSLRESALDLVRTFDLEPAPAKATEKRHG